MLEKNYSRTIGLQRARVVKRFGSWDDLLKRTSFRLDDQKHITSTSAHYWVGTRPMCCGEGVPQFDIWMIVWGVNKKAGTLFWKCLFILNIYIFLRKKRNQKCAKYKSSHMIKQTISRKKVYTMLCSYSSWHNLDPEHAAAGCDLSILHSKAANNKRLRSKNWSNAEPVRGISWSSRPAVHLPGCLSRE